MLVVYDKKVYSCFFQNKREIDKLPTEGRPLSKVGHLHNMYEIRKPMSERFCDISVDNRLDPEFAVAAIISALHLED